MSKIVFFSIPAYGHTNPTIEVVRELSTRGHEVWYYSFDQFKEKIEAAGAKFISCDTYLPILNPKDEKKIGKDFSALIGMVSDTTLALDQKVCTELSTFSPDCIVSDSVCFWGKLFSIKLNIPFICSTTTFAFNQQTAKLMKQSPLEIWYMITGMKKINQKLVLLREHGYAVKNFISLIQNDNDTTTIVYTSKMFQPMNETFSDRYSFVGPSIQSLPHTKRSFKQHRVYISLGTVNNKNIKFYKNCISAFKDEPVDVILSIGEQISINELGKIPSNFEVKPYVDQLAVLQEVDVFITHAGMNSVNESLYYGVPMVLFPQQSEQKLVATRVCELGSGHLLKRNQAKLIKEITLEVINNSSYRERACEIGNSFRASGGASKAADVILDKITDSPPTH